MLNKSMLETLCGYGNTRRNTILRNFVLPSAYPSNTTEIMLNLLNDHHRPLKIVINLSATWNVVNFWEDVFGHLKSHTNTSTSTTGIEFFEQRLVIYGDINFISENVAKIIDSIVAYCLPKNGMMLDRDEVLVYEVVYNFCSMKNYSSFLEKNQHWSINYDKNHHTNIFPLIDISSLYIGCLLFDDTNSIRNFLEITKVYPPPSGICIDPMFLYNSKVYFDEFKDFAKFKLMYGRYITNPTSITINPCRYQKEIDMMDMSC